MAGIPCASPGCLYNTDNQVPSDSDMPTKLALLQIHDKNAHPIAAAPQAAQGHYSSACSRCPQCHSWGHKSSRSKKCTHNKKDKVQTGGARYITNSLFSTFIGQQLSGVFSQHDISIATVGTRKGRVIPLNHQVFDKDRGWIAKPSAPHPTILVTAKPCPDDHSQFGHPVTNNASLRPILSSSVCADTGCQSTAIPPSYAYNAGYRRKDFIPVASKMNGAGRSDLGVIGAVVMEFTCAGSGNEIFTTKQLCYVCEKVNIVYLSRQALTDLHCISPQFPTPLAAQQRHSSAAVQREDEVEIPQEPLLNFRWPAAVWNLQPQ